jgi:hypothetical protein
MDERELPESLPSRAAAQSIPESLSDEELLAVADGQMEPALQDELSKLLEWKQEGELDETGQRRLDDLMRLYRTALVRKARALQLAVHRGLRPPLS